MHPTFVPKCSTLVAASILLLLTSWAGNSARAATTDFKPCPFPNITAAVDRFSKVIQFKTVSDLSTGNHARYPEEFSELDAFLQAAYPEVWQQLKVEKAGVDSLSYLITWPGSQPQLRPALFISHFDVVPVPEDSYQDWEHPPFSGAVADGYIWGRGTLDVKSGAIGLLEAATALLHEGFVPQRTLIFGFGHDEEVGGSKGAAHLAQLLSSRYPALDFIWDEGSGVAVGGVNPFITAPVALVATSEKGYVSIKVTLTSPGGHSSQPPVDGSSLATRMAALLAAVDSDPPPAALVSPTKEHLVALAAVAPVWLGPLLVGIQYLPGLASLAAHYLAGLDGRSAAAVRTTAAITNISVSNIADNVLPQTATVNINFRLLPGDTVDDALQLTKQWLGPAADYASITMGEEHDRAAPVTDASGPQFALLRAAIQSVWGTDLPVVPYLMSGGTDSKHYRHLTNSTLRFCPYSQNAAADDAHRVHGTNERLSVEDFGRALCTYRAGLRLAGAARPGEAGDRSRAAGTGRLPVQQLVAVE
uniref:Peptidase M20 dimerisation domain-containing protein n=1 Tax=Tetradesmus obliquus TaxID=3088 RepID=A0A383W7F7_TETOB|eukprot:jgi/Sobl393_1/365/SZX71997.1